MVEGNEVRCAGREFDQYGRLIARCATGEVPDIGAQFVVSGLAWAFVKYSTDHVGLEKAPRAKQIGIWQSKTHRLGSIAPGAGIPPQSSSPLVLHRR